ncbi:MAG: DNA/RNA helicase domain-containing protein, partial [Bacilli bacterium]
LKEQFRMNASNELINWIDNLVEKKQVNEISFTNTKQYEFKVFSDPQEMHECLIEKDKLVGLSRIVATFDYEHKKNGEIFYVQEEGLKLPWNIVTQNVWAQDINTRNEVGSIYTIQGFDLNYVGVIIGPSIKYDETRQELVIAPEYYKDLGAFNNIDATAIKHGLQASDIKEKIILNSLNILLKRGVKGLYIYAHDKNLNKRLLEIASNYNNTSLDEPFNIKSSLS